MTFFSFGLMDKTNNNFLLILTNPTFKFTHKSCRKNVTFLDVDVKFLHIKATDQHQYQKIHSIQSSSDSRICSFEQDFERHRHQVRSWFFNRGYPKWLIDTEVEKINFPCASRKRDTKMKGISSVITYHPLVNPLTANVPII